MIGALAPANAERQPNIVFILIDDYGWRDTNYNGSIFWQTPEIASLSRGGMVFASDYSASPMCSPTRAVIKTGKYPRKVRIKTVSRRLPGG